MKNYKSVLKTVDGYTFKVEFFEEALVPCVRVSEMRWEMYTSIGSKLRGDSIRQVPHVICEKFTSLDRVDIARAEITEYIGMKKAQAEEARKIEAFCNGADL